MKGIVVALAALAVARLTLRTSGPVLATRMRQMCTAMLEGGSSPCPPKREAA